MKTIQLCKIHEALILAMAHLEPSDLKTTLEDTKVWLKLLEAKAIVETEIEWGKK